MNRGSATERKTETQTEDRKSKTQVCQDPAEEGRPRDSWTLVGQQPKSTDSTFHSHGRKNDDGNNATDEEEEAHRRACTPG